MSLVSKEEIETAVVVEVVEVVVDTTAGAVTHVTTTMMVTMKEISLREEPSQCISISITDTSRTGIKEAGNKKTPRRKLNLKKRLSLCKLRSRW